GHVQLAFRLGLRDRQHHGPAHLERRRTRPPAGAATYGAASRARGRRRSAYERRTLPSIEDGGVAARIEAETAPARPRNEGRSRSPPAPPRAPAGGRGQDTPARARAATRGRPPPRSPRRRARRSGPLPSLS